MEGKRVVAIVSGPGSKAEMKAEAAMEARSWEAMVCVARCQWILRVR